MILDGRFDEVWRYRLINLDTKEEIKYRAYWVDDEKGIWKEYATDKDGHFIMDGEHPKEIIRKGNIKLEKID